jgi:hypothetical protein
VNFIPNFLMKKRVWIKIHQRALSLPCFFCNETFPKGKKVDLKRENFVMKDSHFPPKKKISNFYFILFEFFSPHLDSDFSLVASL